MKSTAQYTHEEYKTKLAEVDKLAVAYAKSGIGSYSLRKAFNELCEGSGSNHAVDNDIKSIQLGRRIMAERVALDTLGLMKTETNRKLMAELIEIANDDAPGVTHHRGFHR